MGDHKNSPFVPFEVVFKPALGNDVQVIGRFIQKKQGRGGKEELRDSDSHLPAAAEFAGLLFHIGLFESETVQNGFNTVGEFFHIVVFQFPLPCPNELEYFVVVLGVCI